MSPKPKRSRASLDPGRDPQGRPFERKTCSRKKRHSKIGAELAVSKHGGRYYRCPFCHGYHVSGGK